MKKILLSSTVALALTGIGASAVLADGGQRGRGDQMFEQQRPDFAELDTNGDGVLTLAEIQASGQNKFAEADTNGDGFLDAEELAAAAERQRLQRFERMIAKKDSNGDGMLSIEEMGPGNAAGPRDGSRMFAYVDADENGEVTQEEWDSAMKNIGERGERGERGGDRRHGGRN